MAISKIENDSLASGVPQRSQLPAGTVLQVVSVSTNTQVSTASYQTPVSTGFSASITPTSATSKILVCLDCGGSESNGSSGPQASYWLYRNGSSIFRISNRAMYQVSGALGPSCNYLDSPSTTSATTYTIYFASESSGNTLYFCTNSSGGTLTLMEIAA